MKIESEFHSLFQSASEASSSKSKTRSSERSRLRLRVHKNRSRYNYDLLMRHGIGSVLSSSSSRKGVSAAAARMSESPAASAAIGSPFLEVNHNPSSFSVYAAIRQTVLENKLRRDSLLFASTITSPSAKVAADDSYEEDDESEKKSAGLPKIVGLGLTVIFELISESRTSNPSLCSRGLRALLDTLQGQVPESMRREPADLMDSLFSLLLSLSTSDEVGDDDDGRLIRSLSSACLLSLVVAIGDTGKMLKAIASLITSKRCQETSVEAPAILTSMQKSVDRVMDSSRQSAAHHITFPIDALCDGVFCENGSSAPLTLLSSLRTLTKAHQLGLTVNEEESVKVKGCSREDFSTVCRFESHGGGWGYSGHSIEAIRFSADTDILCGGFGLFGGRGEYMAKLRLYDIGNDGGEHESEGEMLAESSKVPFECPARHKFPILFDEPIHLQANRWYVAWAMISGPSSDCGSQGQQVVNAGSGEDQITFYFKSSSKSNNGTDVNAGQIPTIMYKLLSPADIDSAAAALVSSNQEQQVTEPIAILSRDLAFGVSADCFTSLLLLLSWSWQSFELVHRQLISAPSSSRPCIVSELKHLSFVASVSLHLLKVYVNEVFPNILLKGKSASPANTSAGLETAKIADCVADTRTLMKEMLTGSDLTIEPEVEDLLVQVMSDCSDAFMSCYHAFYPSASLRWKGLSDLLLSNYSSRNEKLLAAVLSSLCSPFVKLTFPLNQTVEIQSQSSSKSNFQDLSPPAPTASFLPESAAEIVLIERMMEKESTNDSDQNAGSFRDIVFRLLAIIGQPIEVIMCNDEQESNEDVKEHSIGCELVEITCNLVTCILNELVSQSIGMGSEMMRPSGQVVHFTPSRFSRVLQNRTWNTGNGSPDAICFSVDRAGIFVTGVTLYGGVGNEWHYELEVLEYQGCQPFDSGTGSSGHQWFTIELTRGTYSLDESKSTDVSEIRFDRPVPIKANNKYAIRLKNHGARTNNGDGGMVHVRGPDGTTFTFSDCLLSFNGTNHKRGQIPQILYYSTPIGNEGMGSDGRTMDQIPSRRKFLKLYIPTRNVLSIGEAVFNLSHELLSQAIDNRRSSSEILNFISKSQLICQLMPSVLSHLIPLASKDPKCAILIVSMIRRLLPLVSKINKMTQREANVTTDETTTSNHCVVVESDHPYKTASVSNHRVNFSSKVKWMSLEFDPRCGTAQPEDSLQMYIPSLNRLKFISASSSSSVTSSPTSPATTTTVSKSDCDILSSCDYWPVCKRMTGRAGLQSSVWPSRTIILPGNEIIFSLETASDYLKDEKACFYGFRVQVTGYETAIPDHGGFQVLEQELTYVGVTCLHNLLNKEVPIVPFSPAKPIPMSTCTSTNTVVSGEAAAADDAVIQQAAVISNPFRAARKTSLHRSDSGSLEGVPLKEFVNSSSGSPGVSPWLQPESYVDPDNCEVESRSSLGSESFRCNWPVVITITTKDQYKSLVHAPGLKIEVTAQPIHCSSSRSDDAESKLVAKEILTEDSNAKEQNANNLSSAPGPCFSVPYSVTVKDKIRYHSISMMPAYENYSHEELRFASTRRRSAEQMIVRDNRDGTFTASWTPTASGWYQMMAMIDGEVLPGTQVIQVMETHKGSPPAPPKNDPLHPSAGRNSFTSTAVSTQAAASLLPKITKTRKFVGKDSAGLRIRSLPSLQSAQIGLIESGEVISFLEEMRNDDGIWVRLTPESIKKYCHEISNEMSNDPEAWALQYNQHYWQSLLVPTEAMDEELFNEEESMDGHFAMNGRSEREAVIQSPHARESIRSHQEERRRRKKYRIRDSVSSNGREEAADPPYPCSFQVIKSGPSGHNIRSRPCLNSSTVGMCMLGNVISVSTESVTQEGTWLKLTEESKKRYCFSLETDAWVLASNPNGKILFLQPQTDAVPQVVEEETPVRGGRLRPETHHTSPELLLSRRNFALQTLTWFLKNVTQPICLHDILWSFVSGFTPHSGKVQLESTALTAVAVLEQDGSKSSGAPAHQQQHHHPISSSFDRGSIILSSCKDHVADISIHPLTDVTASFKTVTTSAAHCLSSSFHSFLQAVSDLMPALPSGEPLLQIAVRCFHLTFDQADHQFLHDCGIFSNISRILSRSHQHLEEAADLISSSSTSSVDSKSVLNTLTDVTSMFELKTSSRLAMMSCLTDRTTETFWESGDEDRNKTKVITGILTNNTVRGKVIYIHIDNGRDIGAKCTHVVIKCSESGDSSSSSFLKIRSQKVDSRFSGWISAAIPDAMIVRSLKMEFKGPDNTLRLRHITILGSKADAQAAKSGQSVQQIQRANCEAETLRVFRYLTSQVLGKLISEVAEVREGIRLPSIDASLESLLTGNPVPATPSRGSQQQTAAAASAADASLTPAPDMLAFTHLQKQVCSHILRSLAGECARFLREWESLLCAPTCPSVTPDDAYCFEMISLLLSLCRCPAGRSYLSSQDDLIINLLSLLHTGSARIQKSVVSLLRQLLPNIEAEQLGSLLGIKMLPVGEQSGSGSRRGSWSDFDPHEAALLDILLSCIAKALTVQTKVKGMSSGSVSVSSVSSSPYHHPAASGSSSKNISSVTLATSIHPKDDLRDRWFMKGCTTRSTAEMLIALLKDMSSGRLGQCWSSVVRDSITENIMNMTRLREEYRSPAECMRTPTLWLALSSLCVMDEDQAERLSNWMPTGGSGSSELMQQQPQHQRPFCANHDDGETLAIILCSVCGNLCPDCDRFLHLHRRTKSHQRQIFKEEEEAIKVDLHEGCGRSKLFWLMSLADSRTLKAKVEFRGENIQRSKGQLVSMHHGDDQRLMITGVCRFCGATGGRGLLEIGNVCGESECQANSLAACSKVHSCGHMCGGIKDEEHCLPCLHSCDPAAAGSSSLKQDADDMCMICFTDALSASPAIQLACGHVFHYNCCRDVLMKRWPGPRITFTFSLCPICKADIDHPVLLEILKPIKSLFQDVRRKAVMRLEYEGLDRSEAITSSTGRFHNDAAGFAMERYAYYVCCKCGKAYFGGEARCDAEVGESDDNYDPNELVCGACSDVSRAQMCPKHGTDFLEYKCRYCCSVAVFFCFGTTHFCNPCHDDFRRVTNIGKKDLPHCPAGSRARQLQGECPLHVHHPATGEEFALGCGVCRNAHTF